MITLKFFAGCADEVGARQKTAPHHSTPKKLVEALPELACLKNQQNLRVAVNQNWAEWTTRLKDGDEVAFLPPVSGG